MCQNKIPTFLWSQRRNEGGMCAARHFRLMNAREPESNGILPHTSDELVSCTDSKDMSILNQARRAAVLDLYELHQPLVISYHYASLCAKWNA